MSETMTAFGSPQNSKRQKRANNKTKTKQAHAKRARISPPASATTLELSPQPQRPVVVSPTSIPSGMRAVWYLGGNQVIKLLTSVEGDFDDGILGKLEAVPTVVGELALSVESLVSDDVTMGDFESDLLARICHNTLAARQASLATPQQLDSSTRCAEADTESVVPQIDSSTSDSAASTQDPDTDTEWTTEPSSSNPHDSEESSYEAVPNPLARITPPTSPFR